MWKKIGLIFLLLLFAAWVVLALLRGQKQVVQQIEIRVFPENEVFFVKKAEILERLNSGAGQVLKGSSLASLNFHAMEMTLLKSPWIEKADVYADHGGTLHAGITQRVPLLRLVPEGKQGYYLDQYGKVMPLNHQFTARVPVVTGSFDTSMHSILYTFGRYVHESPQWKGQIQQIFVQNKNNLILSPSLGNFTIEFGTAERLGEKFEHLSAFYREVLPGLGWDYYQEISVRYKGQVIGRRL